MSKELFVSSTPHETKVAIVEDDQLTEVYFERENEYTLAGSIYKGRVTRVLPGMQSAFVNIGLERDAFLYVSDFLLEEEEDADVLEQVVSRGPAVIEVPAAATETQQEPIDAQEVFPAADEVAGDGHVPAEASEEDTRAEEADREGARRWRGRRRRGRGREPFQERGERDDREQREQRPAETAHEPRTEAPSMHQGLVLPGESISKYQPHAAVQAPPRSQTSSAPQSAVRPSTEFSLDPSQFSANSNVLPGESLAKYRNMPASAAMPSGTSVEVEPQTQRSQDVSYQFATAEPQAEPAAERTDVSVAAMPSFQETPEPEEKRIAAVSETEERLESMNVASIFGGAAVEQPETEEAAQPEQSTPETIESRDSSRQAANSSYEGGSARGVVEEEEIEEEESEMPPFDEEHLDLADYEELEEEELAPLDDQMVPLGRELTEAVRDAHVNEHATGQYEAEGLEGTEFDEEFTDAMDEVHQQEGRVALEGDTTEEQVMESEEAREGGERSRAEVRGPG